mmetsp:Transcript_21144/g.46618  ORF Transcript_21144/g.46618 Transcript_21144/m.46618 type:complete len:532 (+) Transcript_21144:42-1637(+)|eukprot:CAMPEP_0170600858 /NCGR_PEP_ID=MMETSP0224-20130122/17554_1 /TAXON_ID=285029 /ORGANISM="Togula jolla, Strain CCCM 725" /LENGTH=531 /DNA_ID=CAMNT_0010925603 /DNA_START=37 /DNA_END=1632 /DNA_ORIENTATION=-
MGCFNVKEAPQQVEHVVKATRVPETETEAAPPVVEEVVAVKEETSLTSCPPPAAPAADELDWVGTSAPSTSPPTRSLVAAAAQRRESQSDEKETISGTLSSSPGVRIEILLEGGWRGCGKEESKEILTCLALGAMKFELKARGQTYLFDFTDVAEATQKNLRTGKVRQMRLIDYADDHGDGTDVPSSSATVETGTAGGFKNIRPETKDQMDFGPQSLRGGASQSCLKVLEGMPHAQASFAQFAANERKYCGEWAVFYHSYSFAALIYEVHAAVGSVLFRFRSQYATLPRILVHEFAEIPDAPTLVRRFNTEFASDKRDHNPKFRAVGLSTMCSLVSVGPEACIPMVFVAGYSCKDLNFRSVLDSVLRSCYVPDDKVKNLGDKIIALSEKHGLDVSEFGGKACKSTKAGHLLQIFVKRKLVDRLTYAAKPYGPPDQDRMPISSWMNGNNNFATGQARIVAHPKFFMQANCVRLFVASADADFQRNRTEFQKELTQLLGVILGQPELRMKAATGIYGGTLPSWWTAEDQREKA